MRKIESNLIKAMSQGKNYRCDNTHATLNENDGSFAVYLHGNHICDWLNGEIKVNINTLKRWPSMTTRSRLRALGADLKAKRGDLLLNGVSIWTGV